MTPNAHYQVMFCLRAQHPKTGLWYNVSDRNYHDPAVAARIAAKYTEPVVAIWWHCPRDVASQTNPQARYYAVARKYTGYHQMPLDGSIPPDLLKGRPTGKSAGRPAKHGERGQTYTIYIPPSVARKLINATPSNEISAGVLAAAALLPNP